MCVHAGVQWMGVCRLVCVGRFLGWCVRGCMCVQNACVFVFACVFLIGTSMNVCMRERAFKRMEEIKPAKAKYIF